MLDIIEEDLFKYGNTVLCKTNNCRCSCDNTGCIEDHPVVELLDFILFFRSHMPMVTYLRLDGSTPAGSRHALVQR